MTTGRRHHRNDRYTALRRAYRANPRKFAIGEPLPGTRKWHEWRRWRREQQKAACDRWLRERGLTGGFPSFPIEAVLSGTFLDEDFR